MKKLFSFLTLFSIITPIVVFGQFDLSDPTFYRRPIPINSQPRYQELPSAPVIRPQAPQAQPSIKPAAKPTQKPKVKNPPLNLGVIERDDSFWKKIREYLISLEQPPAVVNEPLPASDTIFTPYQPVDFKPVAPAPLIGFTDLLGTPDSKPTALKNPFEYLSDSERASMYADITEKLSNIKADENALESLPWEKNKALLEIGASLREREMDANGITNALSVIRYSYDKKITHYKKLVDDKKVAKETAILHLQWLEKLGVGKPIKPSKVTANPGEPISIPVSPIKLDLNKELKALLDKSDLKQREEILKALRESAQKK